MFRATLLFQYWTKRQTHCGRSKGLGKYLCPVSLRLSLLLLSFWHSLLLCCQFERRFDDTGRQALYSALGQLIVHSGANEAVNKILVLPKEGK